MDAAALTTLLQDFSSSRRWVIAYSGGLDSHVLLHSIAQLPRTPPLLALHINHGLHPQAEEWQAHCAQVCRHLGVPFQACAVSMPACKRRGLEDAARHARYAVFAQEMQENNVLLLAHHADDQAETILLRLLRGSGTLGLAGMPVSRPLGKGSLYRPLLHYSKVQLRRYAEQHALSYIEDSSNVDTALDRNYLRHSVLPLIRARWPNYRESWLQSAAWLLESAEINTVQARYDLTALDWRPQSPGGSLCIAALLALSPARAKNAVRYACSLVHLEILPQQQLLKLLTELPFARVDAQPCICWAQSEARRYAGRLYLLPQLRKVDNQVVYKWSGQPLVIEGVGKITGIATNGPGLPRDDQYTVHLRRGGEVFKPRAQGGSKSLKKWLQESGVPPWLRNRIPLVYAGDQLAAIGDLWINAALVTRESAIKIEFERIFQVNKPHVSGLKA